jgi:thioredoxin-dependent peroxiredoxin
MLRYVRMSAVILLTASLLWFSAGRAAALQVGDQAPTFKLPATTAETLSLADYMGKQNVVIFFYIAAFGRA